MKLRLPGVLLLTLSVLPLTSCLDDPHGSESWRRPPRYGHGGTDRNPQGPNRGGGENRFGYAGDEGGAPSSGGNSGGGATAPSNDAPEVKKPSGPPSSGTMPFAKGVPGKPLSVKLPGRESLGEISIEQFDSADKPTGKPLPPGTPVSIPDPENPGKMIYFKVP